MRRLDTGRWEDTEPARLNELATLMNVEGTVSRFIPFDPQERKEIGAGKISRGVDDNRLEGHSTETAVATFLFRATVKKGRKLRYIMGFTDDGGHDHELVETFIFR